MKLKTDNLRIMPSISGGVFVSFESADRPKGDLSKYENKVLTVDIKGQRKGRSLDANAYMWVLCEKIAQSIHATREDVYREAVRHVGKFTDIPAIPKDDAKDLIRSWGENGIGWFTEYRLKGETAVELRLYHGSSVYDTYQMSRLIDYIVSEAHDLGIDTMTPGEIDRMMDIWGRS